MAEKPVPVPITVHNLVEKCLGSSISCTDYTVDKHDYVGEDCLLRAYSIFITCPHIEVCSFFKDEYGEGE